MPPAPAEPGPSFHTDSQTITPFLAITRVPPQPVTFGLDAGKSTCAKPSLPSSLDPSSPAAQRMVMFRWAACSNAELILLIAVRVQRLPRRPTLPESRVVS